VIDVTRLSLNQATVKHLDLPRAADLCADAGISAIGLWRDRVGEIGVGRAARVVQDAGLHVSSLCRGGFFTGVDGGRNANRSAVDDAAALGADVLVLVCGGLPSSGKDLAHARRQVADGIAELVPYAQAVGVRLGIEPLHPMFCADRCVVSTLAQAVELAAPFPSETVGVIVDTYHVWWDPALAASIQAAGDRIASFQVCDWVVPLPADMLLGRGHVGDGYVDFAPIAEQVEAAGYTGYIEVEIFNETVWNDPPDRTVATIRERFAQLSG